jgi:hypothetical protein
VTWDDAAASQFERPDLGPLDRVRWVLQYPWSQGYLRSQIAVLTEHDLQVLTVDDLLRRTLGAWREDRQ